CLWASRESGSDALASMYAPLIFRAHNISRHLDSFKMAAPDAYAIGSIGVGEGLLFFKCKKPLWDKTHRGFLKYQSQQMIHETLSKHTMQCASLIAPYRSSSLYKKSYNVVIEP
ncbi:hypothetical protein, partial [Formosimonas limnophila]|uniref:hypothetical protein n=1 Tax=Formosimonas limnophila TaxID=1384487 RepID=UPI001E56955E